LSHQAPIRPAAVVGNQWDTYDTAVSWLSTSAAPLTGGNIVLFGHNTQKLFGILKQLKRGDLLTVTTQERVIPYRVYESVEVMPSNITYITSDIDRLTMYTCSGPFDSRRLFVLARPLITN
jgi:LPXTG-site transpeptidase (sortase) family protein